MNDPAPRDHNQPPELVDNEFDAVQQRVTDLIGNADRWQKERPKITDQDMAERCSAFIDQIQAERKAVEKRRKDINAPYNAFVRANNERHNGLSTRLETALKLMRDKLAPWLERLEEERRAEEERKRKAAEEAQRVAEEAQQRAQQEAPTVEDVVAAEEAQRAAEEAQKEAERTAKTRVGVKPAFGAGRAKSTRTPTVVVITDKRIIPAGVLRRVDDEAILKVLRADLDLARSTPGVEVKQERTVV